MARVFHNRLGWVVGLIFVAAVGSALIYLRDDIAPFLPQDTANYRIHWDDNPKGWAPQAHGPQTLFLFRHKESNVLLRGAVTQVVADYNPTPELHTDGLAQHFIDRTIENMPEWRAEMLDKVPAGNTWFRLIRRTKSDKTVITAYAVKGNTSLIVSMSGNEEKEMKAVESLMPTFRSYLNSMSLTKSEPQPF